MGQAFDRNGQLLGEAFGATKSEVLEKLLAAHGDKAEEIRIRTIREDSGASVEMPCYKCHKEVHALKIKAVTHNSVLAQLSGNESDGSALITPEEDGYSEFRVDADYVRKHKPVAGGYFVVYDDGYTSFSPAEAFENGYTRI